MHADAVSFHMSSQLWVNTERVVFFFEHSHIHTPAFHWQWNKMTGVFPVCVTVISAVTSLTFSLIQSLYSNCDSLLLLFLKICFLIWLSFFFSPSPCFYSTSFLCCVHFFPFLFWFSSGYFAIVTPANLPVVITGTLHISLIQLPPQFSPTWLCIYICVCVHMSKVSQRRRVADCSWNAPSVAWSQAQLCPVRLPAAPC